jgi:acyl-CoA reductase-like NAD-dependent aldehyde dehydrogenase
MNIINPATGTLISTVAPDTVETINDKLAILKKGQVSWSQVPLNDRVSALERFSGYLLQHLEACAAILSMEVGKPIQQARNEVNGACSRINWFTENASNYLSEEWITMEGLTKEKIVYEPLGVVCNISAWNYPYLVGTNVFVAALIAGNAVFYKPSELAILSGMQIQKYLYEAGVPENVFQLAIGSRDIGALLLDIDMDGYFFTGSYETGKYINERISGKLKPCGLELGGKDGLYITDEITDLKAVAASTADGAFYNNGQSCCSVERIYVHEKVYDKFLAAFVAEVQSYKVGDPSNEDTYIGALTRKVQPKFLAAQVADAIAKGATVLCGGHIIESEGYFFEPTVITNVTHEMDLMREESFGPIIGIMKVHSDAEAIELINDSEFGLTAAVYSNNEERVLAIQAKLDVGTVYWNCCDRVSASLPWSGRKHSGMGSTLSHAGLRTFTQLKAYHLKG